MMAVDTAGTWFDGRVRRTRTILQKIGMCVFGDRIGLAIFLGSVCFAGLYWRAGLFITDNATLVETLRAVSQGRLWIEPAGEGAFNAPGTVTSDGLVYGRNYGQIFAALPVLWALQALDTVADLHVGLLALWHLLLFAFVLQLGRLTGRERQARLGGGIVVILLFLSNLALVSQFADPSLPLLALQLSTLIAAGLSAVLLYRLLTWKHGRPLGILAGGATVLVLPVGFWATIPKRHVLGGLLCLAVLSLFAWSRTDDRTVLPAVGPVPLCRAGMYACIAMLTWIHAAEGLFVFLAVVLVDLPTAPSNDRRTLAVVGGVFAAAMVPFLATNLLVSGSPLRPPRALYSSGLAIDVGAGGTGGGTGTGSTGGTSGAGGSAGGATSDSGSSGPTGSTGSVPSFLGILVGTISGFLADFFLVSVFTYVGSFVLGIVTDGLAGLSQFGDLSRTFLRSSGRAIAGNPQFRGVNLAVLESTPLLAAAVGSLLVGGRALLTRPREWFSGVDATDALAVGMGLGFVLIYIGRLPLRVTVNVRYLFVLYPLGLYLVARSGPVRAILDSTLRTVCWTYAVGVLVGSQLMVVYVAVRGLSVAEAAQIHALVGLAAAAVLAVTVGASAFDRRFRRLAAVAFGLAAAAGTAFLLLSGLWYFGFAGEFVLPISEVVNALLASA